jgi:hypothetical protein
LGPWYTRPFMVRSFSLRNDLYSYPTTKTTARSSLHNQTALTGLFGDEFVADYAPFHLWSTQPDPAGSSTTSC